MRNYPLCRVCGRPTGGYQIKAHLGCIKGKNHHLYRKNNKPFFQCDKKGNVLTIWHSAEELGRLTQFKIKAVKKVLHGQFKTHKGFQWKYVQDMEKYKRYATAVNSSIKICPTK